MSGLGEGEPHGAGAIWRRALPVWAGLVVLLGATLGLAYVPMGSFNVVVSLGIAVAKAALVVVFFMQLRKPDPLLRLTAFTALVFVAFMLILTFADELARSPPAEPGTVVPTSEPNRPETGYRAF